MTKELAFERQNLADGSFEKVESEKSKTLEIAE